MIFRSVVSEFWIIFNVGIMVPKKPAKNDNIVISW